MTFINHAFTMYAIAYFLGITSPLVLVLAAILGSLPDTLPWVLYKFFNQPRWGQVYAWFHTSKMGHILGFPHVWFDHLIHPPVLARKGENAYMDEIILRYPGSSKLKLTRHDIIWLTGEAMLFLFGLVLILCA